MRMRASLPFPLFVFAFSFVFVFLFFEKWVEGMECSSEWMVGSAAKKQQWMDEQQKTIDGPAKMRMYPAMVAGTRFVLPTRGKF
uniref:Secreted protein n=1 Tax=Meloidogyne incognita TaxID=6306 RepID=A0A914L6F8_MELIC